MKLVNATAKMNVVENVDGKEIKREVITPFTKLVLDDWELCRMGTETAESHSGRVMDLYERIRAILVAAGHKGRGDSIVDDSENGDGSSYRQCNADEPGCVTIKSIVEGCLNNGIDLALRAVVKPKKMSAKQIVESNRKLALAWAAKHAGTNPEFMTEFVGKIALGSDVAADWVLTNHSLDIAGLL